jgi:serine/threonine protein kinase
VDETGTATQTRLHIPGYELLKMLGSGGMGTVYLARQKSLKRHVAIKVLDRVGDPTELRRFERESLLATAVNHPNVVFIIDAGTADGVPFLVQEYVDGTNLADLLTQRRPTISEICDILEPVVAALSQLHDVGILHRDFKPRNILIDSQGRPKLSDFGLAVCRETASTLTQTETVVGTLDYMAPEQRHRLDVDERADQYSLAAVVYELLTGDKPLGVIKPPSELNNIVPAAADAVVLRALARDPDERYSDVMVFFRDLRRTLQTPATRPVWNRLTTVVVTAVASILLTAAAFNFRISPPTARSGIVELPLAGPEDSTAESDRRTGVVELNLDILTFAELQQLARDRELTGYSLLNRAELIELIKAGGRQEELPPGWTSEIRVDVAGRRYRWYISPDGKSYRRPPDTNNDR